MVIEKNAAQMIDLVLQDDGVESVRFDGDLFPAKGLISFDSHLVVPIDVAFVLIVHGKAALSGFEIAFLDGIGDDFGIHELIGRKKVSLHVATIMDDEHPFVDADLGRGEADPLSDRGMLRAISFVLRELKVIEHLIKRLLVLYAQGQENILRREAKGWIFVFDDFYHR